MAFLVSPGVEIKETDLTNIIPAVSTSIAGYAGVYEWGPCNEVTQVTSETDLISKFGYPVVSTNPGSSTRVDWYAAANFLGYSSNLQLVRILADGARNAASEPFAAKTASISAVFTGTLADSEATIINGFPISIEDSELFTYTIPFDGTNSVTFDIRKPYMVLPDSDYVPGLAYLPTDSDSAKAYFKNVYNRPDQITDSDIVVADLGLTYETVFDSDSIRTALGLSANDSDSDAAALAVNNEIAARYATNQANDTAVAAEIAARIAANTILDNDIAAFMNHAVPANDSDSDARALLISVLKQRAQSEWDSDQTFKVHTAVNLAERFADALKAQLPGIADSVRVDSDGGSADNISDPTVTYLQVLITKPTDFEITESRNAIKVKYFEVTELEASADAATEVVIQNANDFLVVGDTLKQGSVYARYPGSRGNGIGIALIDAGVDSEGVTVFGNVKVGDYFDTVPKTSVWGEENFGAGLNDEVHAIVYTTDTRVTGTRHQVLETYAYLSKAKNAVDGDGGRNYYVNKINDASDWVWILNEESYATDTVNGSGLSIGSNVENTGAIVPFKTFKSNVMINGVISYDLNGGTDGNDIDDGDIQLALDVFKDAETVDISLMFAGNWSLTNKKYLLDICEHRKDAICFLSPDYSSAVTNPTAKKIVDYFNNDSTGVKSSSYAVFDSAWKRQYDKYNDGYFWIPCAPDMAGLAAKTDQTNEPWYSPAGLNRGHLRNVVKLSFSPTQADRDELYKNRVNPIVTFRGQGTLLYGDKTALSRPSAFDRINVRRLFIVLEKAIATAAKFQLFEFNNDITRGTFLNMVEPFLNDVKTRRGMTDFRVVCDTSNNTPEVIDTNRFVADIYIKPARSINFITLNFVAVRTGVSFNEIIQR